MKFPSKKRKGGPSNILTTLNSLNLEAYRTPLKKIKKNGLEVTQNSLSNTERSLAYLQSKLGSRPHRIAATLNRNYSTINNFLTNVATQKTFAPRHYAKGRWKKNDTKLTERHKNLLKKWLRSGMMRSARQCWSRLNKVRSLIKVSYHPVNSYLKTVGSFVRPKLKTRVSPANRAKRLDYCRNYKDFNFHKVIFTDEFSFQIHSNNIRAFRFKGQPPTTTTKFNPNHKIMVWAGISYYGKTSLHFVQGRLNQTKYIDVLRSRKYEIKKIFNRRGRWYFQQDNAPCQRVKDFIKDHLGADLIPHPPQSPDLSPIELIWAFMKARVEASRPTNKQQLKNSIERTWRQVSLGFIRRCIDNLQKKMEDIVSKNGDIL